jgi:hypothetical protein
MDAPSWENAINDLYPQTQRNHLQFSDSVIVHSLRRPSSKSVDEYIEAHGP